MIKTFKKIETDEKVQFSMPLSLRVIKTISEAGISWQPLHFVDVLSLYYSILIDKAKEYLKHKQQEKLQKRGISEVKAASMEDFNKL